MNDQNTVSEPTSVGACNCEGSGNSAEGGGATLSPQSSVLSPARRGRPPKEKAFADLDAALRAEILNAIDSCRDENAMSIYRRFGLAQRGLRDRHFKQVVHDRRATAANRPAGVGACVCDGDRGITDHESATDNTKTARTGEVPEWEELDCKCRRLVNERLDAGDAKIYEIVGVMQATFKRRETVIKEEAERREAEKFERQIAEMQRKADAAIAAAEAPQQDPAKALERLRDDVRMIYGIKV